MYGVQGRLCQSSNFKATAYSWIIDVLDIIKISDACRSGYSKPTARVQFNYSHSSYRCEGSGQILSNGLTPLYTKNRIFLRFKEC